MKDRVRLRHFVATMVVVVLAPLLVSAATKRSPALRSVEPTVPLSLVRHSGAAPGALGAPGEPATITTPATVTTPEATPATSAPAGGARPAVRIEPLPSREITVDLVNVNTSETASFDFSPGGYVRLDQTTALEQFFRCRRTGRHMPLAPGVLAILLDVAQRWPGRVIEVVSGFRAPPFGAAHSRHFTGHAIDLRVRGVRTTAVRDFLWAHHRSVGVGHYDRENFVHVDFRPDNKDTAWSARGEDEAPQFNPRWASKARRRARSL
jgi:uncharacterized protein YcbK (DUF882 family)